MTMILRVKKNLPSSHKKMIKLRLNKEKETPSYRSMNKVGLLPDPLRTLNHGCMENIYLPKDC